MAIVVAEHPVELAHLSDKRHNVDLAPTSLAQGPNPPRSRSRMAHEAQNAPFLLAHESPATPVALFPKCLRHHKI
jgi:hypothetical protein